MSTMMALLSLLIRNVKTNGNGNNKFLYFEVKLKIELYHWLFILSQLYTSIINQSSNLTCLLRHIMIKVIMVLSVKL